MSAPDTNGEKSAVREFALDEYRSLRRESLEAIAQQQRAFQLGLVALGALLGLGLRITKSPEAAGPIVLALAGPAIAGCVYAQWQEQQLRGYRTGVYLRLRERQLQCHYGNAPSPLAWERWLETLRRSGRDWINHWSVMLALLLSGLASSAVGLATLVDHHHTPAWIATGVVDLVLVGAIVRYTSGLHHRLKELDDLADNGELLPGDGFV